MKKYFEYAEEISNFELYERLVGFGLFAEKIPNFLSSEQFMAYTQTLALPLDSKPKDYIRYNSMRNINIPRAMAIPEPFAYSNQCRCLASNWDKIKTHFRDKTTNESYKVSRIHLRKMKDKQELFEMSYKNFSKDGDPEQDVIIRSKYIANADISTCFPSIYSHSISWSLVSKSYSKVNRDAKNWFNELDFHTRNVKCGETNGVLIGPHASNLISEIILIAVDHELISEGFKYIRNIDDYTCYVGSYEEADRFFLRLSEELKKYELSLNSKKSKIISLPKANVKNWVTKLNHFNFTNSYKKGIAEGLRVKELKGFLDFSIELMLEHESDAAVINYAIKIISNKYLGINAKNYYIKQIHHLTLLYPYLINLLEEKVFDAHEIEKQKIKEIAIDVYNYGVGKRFYEACSFAIYWAFKYNFSLEISTLKSDSILSTDCIFVLISYLYDKKYNKKVYLAEYKEHARVLRKEDFDRYWLFIYEVLPNNELPSQYSLMKKKGITFIKDGFS